LGRHAGMLLADRIERGKAEEPTRAADHGRTMSNSAPSAAGRR
jgi:hypothetical protein